MKKYYFNRIAANISVAGIMLVVITTVAAQPVLHTNTKKLSIRDGHEFRFNTWNIDPTLKPDIYQADVKGKKHRVAFISDIDSIVFEVEIGKKYPFIVLVAGKDSAFTEILGMQYPAKASFSQKYIRKTKGRIIIEVPQVHELMNILIALTATGKSDPKLVYKQSPYYAAMLQWFDQYSKDPLVLQIDSLLRQQAYFKIKTDSYDYYLTRSGKIKPHPVFHSHWNYTNSIVQYIPDMQGFAQRTRFAEFYTTQKKLYDEQIAYFKDSIGVPGMLAWLRKNFPTSDYDAFRIVFSPLMYAYQSASMFDNNGFKEAQAHMNFPYPDPLLQNRLSVAGMRFNAGRLLFTELNHTFINPEADKPVYNERVQKAMANNSVWQEKGSVAEKHYNSSYSCFNEYMNWALISLYAIDKLNVADQQAATAEAEHAMLYRGFRKFPLFNQFLMKLYKNRNPGQTLADLYPAILDWVEQQKDQP